MHFGVGLSVFSVVLMDLATNHLAAVLLAVSILFYVLVYTVWLKRRTAQNIVIGGAAGAFPPLIGWVAATGSIELLPVLAVRDHLPVDAAAFLGAVAVRPLRLCGRQRADASGRRRHPEHADCRSCSTASSLVVAAIAPFALGLTGLIYGVAAAVLNTVFVILAAAVFANRAEEPSGNEAGAAAVRFLHPLPVRIVRRAGGRSVGGRMNPHPEDELLRRQRERARLMAWLLGAFVILLFLITIAKIGLNK